MKKTHKKILGFAGLGVVAAVTTVAAILPSPIAAAVTSVTDTIQVYVSNNQPEVTLTTSSKPEIKEPGYSFTVGYDNVSSIKVSIVNKNKDGGIIYSGELWSENVGGVRGSKAFDLDLNDYGGYGNFTIKAVGLDESGVPVERLLTVTYTETPGDIDPDNPEPDVPIDIPQEWVVRVDFKLYDSAGNLRKDFGINDPKKEEDLDFSDLEDGVYTLKITSLNQYDDVIGERTRIIVIDRDGHGEEIGVPIEDQGVDLSKVVITVTNSNGDVITGKTVLNPVAGDTVGITLPDDLPAGIYTITTDYYNEDGQKINTVITYFIKSDTGGHVKVPVEQELDTVTTIETYIYDDETGKVVRTVRVDRDDCEMRVYNEKGEIISTSISEACKAGKLAIPMEGLPSGDYTAVIMFRNKYGYLVGNTKTIHIRWDADKGIIVPDTGSFFQGLNISREDYLITGLVVFMIVGVVAFGVVKKNRNRR